MLNELKLVGGKEVEDFVGKNKRGLHVLEDAYLTSRYFYELFDREDVEYLVSLAEKVMDLCERLRCGLGEG